MFRFEPAVWHPDGHLATLASASINEVKSPNINRFAEWLMVMDVTYGTLERLVEPEVR